MRSLLSAVGDALVLDDELLDDLRTAVSEACNNVVLHAYDPGPGPMTMSLVAMPTGLQVLVRDRGCGMHHVSARADRMGVGLAVISALSNRTEFRSNSDGGTDVRMWFTRSDVEEDAFAEHQPWSPSATSLSGDIVVSLAPTSLLAPVLGRVSRAAAAQSRFTIDGIAEIAAMTDAVAAYAAELPTGGPVDFSLTTTTRRLELTAGPFGEIEPSADGESSDKSISELSYHLEPVLGPHGDRNLLRTVIVDARVGT